MEEKNTISAIRLLATHIDELGLLAFDGPFLLNHQSIDELNRLHKAPPGGWNSLAALAVGLGFLRVTTQGYKPSDCLVELPDNIEQALLQSFTRMLLPPRTAATLMQFIGLHPLAGLKIARSLHQIYLPNAFDNSPGRELSEDLTIIRTFLLSFLDELVSYLALPAASSFDNLVENCALLGKQFRSNLSTLVSDDRHFLIPLFPADHFCSSLVDDVLIPIGVVRRVDSAELSIDHDFFSRL